MPSPTHTLDAVTAVGYIGKPVHVELEWDGDPEPMWRFKHIVGVVLPVHGVNDIGYFLTVPVIGSADFPDETYFDSIRTIRTLPVIRSRARCTSGKVLSRLPLPQLIQGQAKSMEGERHHA
ncbi:hypothetical protein ACOCLD_18140 [Pseudomonas sp. MAC6]|uniref:hypothetical protein n=1 Tax=Pseudomonas sp. MAC6 TaxID=3401633 RepID=UPI003BF5CB58